MLDNAWHDDDEDNTWRRQQKAPFGIPTISIYQSPQKYTIFAGKNLVIVAAGGDEKTLMEDDIRKRHEDEQKAKLASLKGSGRFG